MQHFCEQLNSGPREAIYREMVPNTPKSIPEPGSRRLKKSEAAAN
jgi:hypothetical protein